jgi:hypothetical protein
MPNWLKYLLIVAVILATVAVALVAGGIYYIRSKTLGSLTPAEKVAYKEWCEKPYHFDPKDLATPPFDPGTILAATAFNQYWDTHKDVMQELRLKMLKMEKQVGPTKPTDIRREDLVKAISVHQKWIDDFASLVNRPDYVNDVLAPFYPGMYPGMSVPNMSESQVVSDFLKFQGRNALNRGDTATAFEKADTILKAAKLHPYGCTINVIISTILVKTSTNLAYTAITQCTDTNAIWNPDRFRLCDEIRSALSNEMPLGVRNNIGQLRTCQRAGTPVKFDGLTGREIAREIDELSITYAPSPGSITSSSPPALIRKVLSFSMEMFSFKMGLEIESSGRKRMKSSLARLDLLKLQSALRYIELTDPKRKIAKVEDLVPDLIPVAPKDPYRTDGGTYSFKNGIFYSFGPDGKDDNATLFDEAKESGDIVLEAVK